MVSQCLKNTDVQTTTANTKNLLKQQPSQKYLPLFNTLVTIIKEAWKKEHHANFNWFWSHACIIYQEQLEDETTTAKKHMFLCWFNICMRCQQCNKGQVNEFFCEDLCKWHGLTREHLIRTGFNDAYYDKCENFCQTIYLTLIRHHSYL